MFEFLIGLLPLVGLILTLVSIWALVSVININNNVINVILLLQGNLENQKIMVKQLHELAQKTRSED